VNVTASHTCAANQDFSRCLNRQRAPVPQDVDARVGDWPTDQYPLIGIFDALDCAAHSRLCWPILVVDRHPRIKTAQHPDVLLVQGFTADNGQADVGAARLQVMQQCNMGWGELDAVDGAVFAKRLFEDVEQFGVGGEHLQRLSPQQWKVQAGYRQIEGQWGIEAKTTSFVSFEIESIRPA